MQNIPSQPDPYLPMAVRLTKIEMGKAAASGDKVRVTECIMALATLHMEQLQSGQSNACFLEDL